MDAFARRALVVTVVSAAGCNSILGNNYDERPIDAAVADNAGDAAITPDGAPASGADSGADGSTHDATIDDSSVHPSSDSGDGDAVNDGAKPVDAGSDGGGDASGASSDAGFDAGPECVLDGSVFGPDASSPGNECLVCDPSTNTGSWTIAREGLSCDGIGGSCAFGTCVSVNSCAGGPGAGVSNCGDAGNESCCTSLEIAGGSFYRTYAYSDAGVFEDATVADPATVSSFRLDKYLVTVGRFRRFLAAVNDAGWMPEVGSGKHVHLNGGAGLAEGPNEDAGQTYENGWSTSFATEDAGFAPTNANLATCETVSSTWTPTAGLQENLPIDCVTWPEAYAFCIWDSAFLPSAAESAYARMGGNLEFQYPWGENPPGTSNAYAIFDNQYLIDTGAVENIAPVGTATLGAGRWGQLDLAGELFEWELDWFSLYASLDPWPTPCVDCAVTNINGAVTTAADDEGKGGYVRFVWNGIWYQPAIYMQSAFYNDALPTDRVDAIGFRCARTP